MLVLYSACIRATNQVIIILYLELHKVILDWLLKFRVNPESESSVYRLI
jgi:hypothetical protein